MRRTCVSWLTSRDIKRSILSALQQNKLYSFRVVLTHREEYVYLELPSHLNDKKCKLVIRALFDTMIQSFSLLQSFDTEPLFQKVSLFSSLLFFLITRFPAQPQLELCFGKIQSFIHTELKRSYVRPRADRFSPAYVATVTVFYELCRCFDCVDLFKSVLFTILLKAGAFPAHLINTLFLWDANAFSELNTCDLLMNSIIGETLQQAAERPPEFDAIAAFYAKTSVDWASRITEIEKEVLQCILNEDDYSTENPQYPIAGKCLVLLYVFRGGAYAVESLIDNEIIQRIDDAEYLADYRTFLVYVLCGSWRVGSRVVWIAETNLFGSEWSRIRQQLEGVDVVTSAIQKEFASLFQYLCFLHILPNKHDMI